MSAASVSGLVIVDKPGGMTSHDVVARVRRLAGTRKVGHAGTLDPMATGVLVLGVEKATRLLGYLTLTEKEYSATIRLGQTTSTDDAEGEITGTATAEGVTVEAIDKAVAGLTGEILQVPPAVSAIKVGGQRAYKLSRAGAAPDLAARPVTVYEFNLTGIRRVEGATEMDGLLDLDAIVRCSSGTYIRALARDLGVALGTGGHLTRLRRTRVGGYRAEDARTLEQLAEHFEVLPLAEAAAAAFPRRDLSADEANRLAHGGRLAAATPTAPAPGNDAPAMAMLATTVPAKDVPAKDVPAKDVPAKDVPAKDVPTAAFAPDGTLIALVTEESGQARPLVVFA